VLRYRCHRMTMVIVILVVSAALIAGALWGMYGKLPAQVNGFMIALAGGALIQSLMEEMITPASLNLSLYTIVLFVLCGAGVFTALDYWIDEKWGDNSGGGLLAAITLDGVPENLALGVALIGAGPAEVAALAGAIFLSNLPEAAGGAKNMVNDGHNKKKVLSLWIATAGLLSLSAIVGNLALSDVPLHYLDMIKCFAAGAVVASLATEVFPQSFKQDHHLSGIAVAIGLCVAYALGQL